MNAQPQPPQPRQPDFTELAQCFEHAARQISRFPITPAFNQGDIIITQLQNITQAIGDLRNEMGAPFDASEANALARLHNSAINRLDIPLYSIKDRRNNPVDGFPENDRALAQLSGNELITLLQAFGQATDGNVTAK